MDISEKLYKHNNGLEKCALCSKKIPANVQRISLSYRTIFGLNHFRVCGLCLIKLAKNLDNAAIEEWRLKLAAEEI
jgi:hypothetical protein